MSINSNTWYSIQSFGTDFFLSAAAPVGGSGSITVSTSGTVNSALWQAIAPSNNTPTDILRTEQYGNDYNGNSYCMTASDLVLLSTQVCDANSDVWNFQYFNGNDASDGWLVSNTYPGTTQRLYIDPTTNNLSVRTYQSGNSSDDIYYQWAIQSVSAINDQAWSTVATISSTPTSSSLFPNTTSSISVPSTAIPITTDSIIMTFPPTTSFSESPSTTITTGTDTSPDQPSPTTSSSESFNPTIILPSSPTSSPATTSSETLPSSGLEGLTSTNYITVQPSSSSPNGNGGGAATRSVSTAIVTVAASTSAGSGSGSATPSTGSSDAGSFRFPRVVRGDGMLLLSLSLSILMSVLAI